MDAIKTMAKANARKPYTCLHPVLRDCSMANTVQTYEALLPWSLHPQDRL